MSLLRLCALLLLGVQGILGQTQTTGSCDCMSTQQNMEGSVNMLPGDYFNIGFDFHTSSSTSQQINITMGGSATVPITCSDGSSSSFVVQIPPTTYTIPSGSTSSSTWYPPGGEGAAASYQGTLVLADYCHGLGANGMNLVNAGPNVSLVGTRLPIDGTAIVFQFHFRDANAKGGSKGNVNCANASAPYQSDAATCQASWSATLTSSPCPAASQCASLMSTVAAQAPASPAATPSASPAASRSPAASPASSPSPITGMCNAAVALYASQYQSTNACGCGASFTASVISAYNCSEISPGCGSYFCNTPMSAATQANIAQCLLS